MSLRRNYNFRIFEYTDFNKLFKLSNLDIDDFCRIGKFRIWRTKVPLFGKSQRRCMMCQIEWRQIDCCGKFEQRDQLVKIFNPIKAPLLSSIAPFVGVIALCTLAGSAQAAEVGETLDCKNSGDKVERSICDNKDLLARHTEMEGLLAHAARSPRKDAPGLKLDDSQAAWLKRRDRCGKSFTKSKCLMQAYNARLAYLEAKFRPGRTKSEDWQCESDKSTFTVTFTTGRTAFGEFVAAGREMDKGYKEWFMAETGKTSGETRQFLGESDNGSQAGIWFGPSKANFIMDRSKFGLVCKK
jgi:uncharacterized protein